MIRPLFILILCLLSSSIFGQSSLQKCTDIGGEFISLKCKCKGIFVDPFSSGAAETCLAGVIKLTQQSLEAVSLVEAAKSCGNHQVQFSEYNPNIKCPTNWLSGAHDNNSAALLGLTKSPAETCADQMTVRAGGGRSSLEVATILGQDPNTTVNGDPGLWSSCFDRPFKNLSEDDKATAVSEHFYAMNRLKQAEIAAIKTLADSDNLLEGENAVFWNQRNANCWDNHFPETVAICQAQARCANAPETSKAVLDDALKFLPIYAEYRSQLQVVSARLCEENGMVLSDCLQEKKDQMEILQNSLDHIEAQYPIMKGKTLRSKLKAGSGREEMKEAYKSQVRENRQQILGRLETFKKAVACLNSPASTDCSRGKIDEALALAPELNPIDVETYLPAGKLQGVHINNLMGRAECLHSSRMNVKEGDKLVVKTSVDLVLALSTAGAGAGLQFLLKAGKLTTALTAAQKSSQFFKAIVLTAKTISHVNSALEIMNSCQVNLSGSLPPSTDPKECLNQKATDVMVANREMLKCSLAVLSAVPKAAKLPVVKSLGGGRVAAKIKLIDELVTKMDKVILFKGIEMLPRDKVKTIAALTKAADTGLLRKLIAAGNTYQDSGKLAEHSKLIGQEIKKVLTQESIPISDQDSYFLGNELMGFYQKQ